MPDISCYLTNRRTGNPLSGVTFLFTGLDGNIVSASTDNYGTAILSAVPSAGFISLWSSKYYFEPAYVPSLTANASADFSAVEAPLASVSGEGIYIQWDNNWKLPFYQETAFYHLNRYIEYYQGPEGSGGARLSTKLKDSVNFYTYIGSAQVRVNISGATSGKVRIFFAYKDPYLKSRGFINQLTPTVNYFDVPAPSRIVVNAYDEGGDNILGFATPLGNVFNDTEATIFNLMPNMKLDLSFTARPRNIYYTGTYPVDIQPGTPFMDSKSHTENSKVYRYYNSTSWQARLSLLNKTALGTTITVQNPGGQTIAQGIDEVVFNLSDNGNYTFTINNPNTPMEYCVLLETL